MANPVSNITIMHGDTEGVGGLEDLLYQEAAEPQLFLNALIAFLSSLVAGQRQGKIYFSLSEASDAVQATGTITVSGGLPSATETLQVGGVTFTFQVSAADEDQITIGADADACVTNIAAAINAHSELVGLVTAAADTTADDVDITATVYGKLGNCIALAEAATNVTVSGPSLQGSGDPAAASTEKAARSYDFGGVS